MTGLLIRAEEPADLPGIHDLVERAFGQAAEADLVYGLRRDGDAVFSVVAVEDDRIVGHVMFSRMTAPFRALALAPVAVAPERQRQGIASQLIRRGLDAARAERWQGVLVLGDPRLYGRFGFEPRLASGFQCRYAGPHLMALALGAPLPTESGKIDYAPAFDALG